MVYAERSNREGFYKNLLRLYGERACYLAKKFSKWKRKKKCLINRKYFLLNCKRCFLIPKFLRFKVRHLCFKFRFEKYKKLKTLFQRRLIKLLIEETFCDMKEIDKELGRLEYCLTEVLPENILQSFLRNLENSNELLFNEIKNREMDKMLRLKNERMEILLKNMNRDWIENLSSTDIPEYVKRVLSLGPNFNLPQTYDEIPYIRIIANIEAAINRKEEAEIIRAGVCNIITNHINKHRDVKYIEDQWLLNEYKKTKIFLKENQQIIVTKADKGNKTIIMNKDEYENKMLVLLDDVETYKKIKKDPTENLCDQIKKLTDIMLQNKWISQKVYYELRNSNAYIPSVYGLVKNKEGRPLRQVVCTINSPTYELGVYISSILTPLCKQNEYQLNNSFEFASLINKTTIPVGYKMISLDVKQLFTNIPTELIFDVIDKRWDEIEEITKIDKVYFKKLVRIILEGAYLRYEDTIYYQHFGVPMGSPASPVIANLVLEQMEKEVLENIQTNITVYRRYVDDTFLIIPENSVDNVLAAFNSYHRRIQFTVEEEIDNQLNFLDMTVIKEVTNLKTKWLHKNEKCRYLDYLSESPFTHKKMVAISLIDRAISLSHPLFRPESLNKVRNSLEMNNYPRKFINWIVKERVERFYNGHEDKKDENKDYFVSIPYVKGLTENLSKKLKKFEVAVSAKPMKKVKEKLYSKMKYKIEKDKKKDVIYKIDCKRCNVSYIGETKQFLKKRVAAHKSSVNTKKVNSSGLSKHAIHNRHSFNFESPKIVDVFHNHNQRLIAESLYIKKNGEKSCNTQIELNNLHNSYDDILNKIHTKNL